VRPPKPVLLTGVFSYDDAEAADTPRPETAWSTDDAEDVAKAAWLRRLDSVRELGPVRYVRGVATPHVPIASHTSAVAARDAEPSDALRRRMNGRRQPPLPPTQVEVYWEDGDVHWVRESFSRQYSGDDQNAVAALGKRGWERSRLSFPYLELACRAWLNSGAFASWATGGSSLSIGGLLFRITRAAPTDKVLNSLLYCVFDLVYKEMGAGQSFPPWAPEPFLLRLPGVEDRMVAELTKLGHILDLIARSPSAEDADVPFDGPELLRVVREMETLLRLLSTISFSAHDGRPEGEGASLLVVERYRSLIASRHLKLAELQAMLHEALAELLDLEYTFVAERHVSIATAFAEWPSPELLFRYLDANSADAQMARLVKRWLRSLLGLSDETLREIRREAPPNVRHLQSLPRAAVLRWYSEACPGTSSMRVLFTLGEDAGSCLRITGNEGNKYNRALMSYVLQSTVRALVVRNEEGRVLARSLVRLLVAPPDPPPGLLHHHIGALLSSSSPWVNEDCSVLWCAAVGSGMLSSSLAPLSGDQTHTRQLSSATRSSLRSTPRTRCRPASSNRRESCRCTCVCPSCMRGPCCQSARQQTAATSAVSLDWGTT